MHMCATRLLARKHEILATVGLSTRRHVHPLTRFNYYRQTLKNSLCLLKEENTSTDTGSPAAARTLMIPLAASLLRVRDFSTGKIILCCLCFFLNELKMKKMNWISVSQTAIYVSENRSQNQYLMETKSAHFFGTEFSELSEFAILTACAPQKQC